MADTDKRFVTRSGLAADILFEGEQKAALRDVWECWYTIDTTDGVRERACVELVAPILVGAHLEAKGLGTFEGLKRRLSLLAVLDNLDGLSELPSDPHGNRRIEVDANAAEALLRRPKLSDRELRRFLSRRIYDLYSRHTLSQSFAIDAFDCLIAGASETDLLRNMQVLEEEGYLDIVSTSPGLVVVRATAKFVREVERYGAPKEDAASGYDLLAALPSYPRLTPWTPTIKLEYGRYSSAQSAIELASVFRALAPTVEAIVKDILVANGVRSAPDKLGPCINALRQHPLGNIGLWSQLSHVLKFGRDLEEHGSPLPEPVLRVACENCFSLILQLGALYPD
jgi:hypothetical protein